MKEIKGFPLKDHVSRRLYCKKVFIFSWPPTPSHPMAGEKKWHFKRGGAFLVSGRWDYKKPECLVSWCEVRYFNNTLIKSFCEMSFLCPWYFPGNINNIAAMNNEHHTYIR